MAMQGNMRRQSIKIHLGMSFWEHVSIYSACNSVFHCIWWYYNPPYSPGHSVPAISSEMSQGVSHISVTYFRWERMLRICMMRVMRMNTGRMCNSITITNNQGWTWHIRYPFILTTFTNNYVQWPCRTRRRQNRW